MVPGTRHGIVTAARVVQATNAQPPGTPGTKAAPRSTVPLTIFQLATQVLPPEARSILPGGSADAADTDRCHLSLSYRTAGLDDSRY